MKLECLKKDFEEAVDITSRVVSNSATLPVLKCVVFEAKGKNIIARSTNLELSIEIKFSADIKTEGSVAIPAQILHSTLKTSPQQSKISLELIDGSIVLIIGGAQTTIKTVPLDDFPTIPKPETKKKHIIPKESLINGVKSVLYSASTSLIKPELASVYIYHEDENLVFVATDSFRLAEKKVPYKTQGDLPTTIMPIKNTTELVRILESQQNQNLEVFIDENQYSIKSDDLYITSRIIDGSFPDYRSILPKKTTTEVVVLKEDLLNTLKKAQIFSNKFGQITLHVYPQKKTFTISARNNDVGEIFDSLDAAITGEDLDISFNHKYLIDVFQSVSSDSVSLSFAGFGKPLIIKGVSDNSFIYLVMPMNK
ncbi:DNA polymerase III subunit beta [bacterium]|nr:DNA polymerase III subunit beta [Parcubacteria group bacterium]MBF05319.1 DNA polymerase III subunit beta [bacterium]|tara:strand:- start:6011 stop:7114 length:1104 start_codon:yes stop_codon:yes gene_type:complete